MLPTLWATSCFWFYFYASIPISLHQLAEAVKVVLVAEDILYSGKTVSCFQIRVIRTPLLPLKSVVPWSVLLNAAPLWFASLCSAASVTLPVCAKMAGVNVVSALEHDFL